MNAVIATPHQHPKWSLRPHHWGRLDAHKIRIRIILAGLCRTDIQSMTGQRMIQEGRILGHEAAGIIEEIGAHIQHQSQIKGLEVGCRVAFFPFLPCQTCPACLSGERIDRCWKPQVVGMDVDGAFATYIDLPLEVIFRVDQTLPWEALAYAEPVAAALSALEVHEELTEQQSLGLLGSGRIATLTERILVEIAGKKVERIHENTPCNSLDALIETRATEATLKQAIDVLKPGGTLFVKSRPSGTVPWPHQYLVYKRIRVIGLHYGDFELGLDLMAQGTLDVRDCWGKVFPFTSEGIEKALEIEALGLETEGKLFFKIGVE